MYFALEIVKIFYSEGKDVSFSAIELSEWPILKVSYKAFLLSLSTFQIFFKFK